LINHRLFWTGENAGERYMNRALCKTFQNTGIKVKFGVCKGYDEEISVNKTHRLYVLKLKSRCK